MDTFSEPAQDMTQTARELVARSALDTTLGVQIDHVDATCARGHLPVAGCTQPHGRWHGGASAVMVETLGSLAGSAAAGPGRIAVGTELSVSHLAPVSAQASQVQGVATLVHRGGSSAVYQVTLDDGDHLIATGRLTCRFLADQA